MIAGPPFLLEFGEQKLKHESMNATNAQNPNKCPTRLFFFPFFLEISSRGDSSVASALFSFALIIVYI